MAKAEDSAQPNYWLLQYSPEDRAFDIGALGQGQVAQWPVLQYAKRILPGDVVFLWIAGESGGMLGWGIIAERGVQGSTASVFVQQTFPGPIPRQMFLEFKELYDLTVISRGQSGTDFSVSTLQATVMARVIRAKGFEAPAIAGVRVGREALRRLTGIVGRAENIKGLQKIRSTIAELRTQIADDSTFDIDQSEKLLTRLLADLRNDAPRSAAARSENEHLIGELETLLASFRAELPAPRLQEVVATVAQPLAAGLSAPNDGPSFNASVFSFDGGGAAASAPAASSPQPAPSPQPAANQQPAPSPPPSTELEVPEKSTITRWWEEDRAEIADDVRNLSRYIMAKSLVPPQAIGVFGDWGSGKTFFMRAVRNEIENLAWQSSTAPTTSFCRHVVQIEFNAWHYVESNLWASLAAHIFESLHAALTDRPNGTKEDADKLFRTLETAKAAVEALEHERRAKEEAVKELQEEHKTVSKAVSDSVVSVEKHREKLVELAAQRIKDALGNASVKHKAQLVAIVGEKQLEAAAVAGKDLTVMAKDARSLGSALLVEWKTRRFALLLALGTAFALIALPSAAAYVVGQIKGADIVTQAGATAGMLLTMFATGVTWLKSKGQGVLDAARQVQGLCAEAAAAAEKEARAPLLEAEVKLVASQKALAAVDEKLAKEKARLAEAESAIKGEDIVVRLRQFLEERVRNKTYEQHLGLVTLIRKDFESLSALMDLGRGREVAVDEKVQVSGTAAAVPLVQRIVLYIDDLDRCPHNKVVDVLQAVHLLLGFKLFVVVVGVDVRWIGKALLKQYPELLDDGRGVQGNGAASSDDYLEKIFQIPFRIPPMNANTRKSFVSALVKPRSTTASASDGKIRVPRQELNPIDFELDPRETEAIIDLHNCLGKSPRRLKRFVEVYRLMRAGMAAGDVEALMTQHHYVGILGVFAMMTSLSAAAPRLVEAFYEEAQAGSGAPTFQVWMHTWLKHNDLRPENYQAAMRVMEYFDTQKKVNGLQLRRGLTAWSHKVGRYAFHDIRVAN